MKSHVIKINNIPDISKWRTMMIIYIMVEHFKILDNETKTITEWTTLGTGKKLMGLGRRH